MDDRVDGAPRFATWNIDPTHLADAGRFAVDVAENPWLARSPRRFRGDVLRSDELVSLEELRRTRFYADFIAPQGHCHAMSLALEDLVGFGPILTFHRTEAQGPFTDSQRARLAAVGSHVIRALEIRARLARAEDRIHGFRSALEATQAAVLLLNAEAHVRWVSAAAEAILRTSPHASVVRGRLVLHDGAAQRRLLERLGRAGRGELEAAAEDGLLSASSPVDVEPLLVRVLGWGQFAPRAGLVFLSTGSRDAPVSPSRLRVRFGLTATEARVVVALTRGAPPRRIAEELEVSESTVKTHLKRIGQKTDTHRQADLVRLVLSIDPWFV